MLSTEHVLSPPISLYKTSRETPFPTRSKRYLSKDIFQFCGLVGWVHRHLREQRGMSVSWEGTPFSHCSPQKGQGSIYTLPGLFGEPRVTPNRKPNRKRFGSVSKRFPLE